MSQQEQDRASPTTAVAEGQILYTPPTAAVERCNMTRYVRWLAEHPKFGAPAFEDYFALQRWSIENPCTFWQSIAEYFEVQFHSPFRVALGKAEMPGTEWFPGATLNYAEHALRRRDAHTAILALDEAGNRTELSYAELSERVGRAAEGLRRLGVGQGDRVAALAPNTAETLVLFLACASLGAVWSSCAPEFGVPSVLDRFSQIEPKVLVTVDGYVYGGKRHDKSAAVAEIARGLPSLEHVVRLGSSEFGEQLEVSVLGVDELCAHDAPLTFCPVPFGHPLWVLYSSGTTGLPKPIVQGHGGILLEHLKVLSLHSDLGPDDRFFWFTTTGWMMWNYLISGLLVQSTVVLYDGSPAHPTLAALWGLAARERVTYFGTSAPFLMSCQKAGLSPGARFDLGSLRAIGSTGAPLPTEGFCWVYEHVSQELALGSVSGGTDVCTAFVLGCPLLPVRAGEIQCAGLGCAVAAFDPEGRRIVGEVGELVLTVPLPSMPLFFWGDTDGSRLRESYFSTFEGVWRHGDWVKETASGGFVIYGRSDSTLNRGGVRMGTSEFYRVVEALPEISDSLVVDTGSAEREGKLWLFLVLADGHTLDADLRQKLKALLRAELSPRHVPDEFMQVRAVPRTLSGKKLEVPIKRILAGVPVERAASRDTLKDPSALDEYVALRDRVGETLRQ